VDGGSAAVNALIAGAAIGLVLYLAYRLLATRREATAKAPAVWVEFWVYANADVRPSDANILKRVFGENPYRGASLGPAEGATLSDVRFHIGFVKREKNAMVFRPDIFSEVDAEIPPHLPSSLEDTTCVVIVRFVSEERVSSRKHLQFITHVVDAIAELTDATMVWDTEAQRFWTRAEFRQRLTDHADGTRFEENVVTHWTETPFEGRAFTRGMAKVGLPDLEFDRQPVDQRTLATHLVEESARRCWQAGELAPCTFDSFGEVFEVEFGPPRAGHPTHRSWISTILAGRKRRIGA